MTIRKLFAPTDRPFPDSAVPRVIFAENPQWEKLYGIAWRQAWDHVYESPAVPVSPYMGEGCATNKIWIWDSCFMALFCRYAAAVFPGIETLDNFYRIMQDREHAEIFVHHADNPPLFAWAEERYFQLTGDKNRLERIMLDKHYLERHYDWLEQLDCRGERPAFSSSVICWKRESAGYRWSGCPSGMDNTPRGRDVYDAIYWVDALAQQGLAALSIARLAAIVGDTRCRCRFLREYETKKALMQSYWDPVHEAFMDRLVSGNGFCPVLTPASFWPLLAEMATREQAESMAELLLAEDKLGGPVPCPSVARDDPDFEEDGRYWRGSVWLPAAYMVLKGLERYGKFELASRLASELIRHIADTFAGYEPHTIWECYDPVEPKPALNKCKRVVRKDFCGWSALGPIALLLENIIGIHHISVSDNTIHWQLNGSSRRGIRNLHFGENCVDLIAENGVVKVVARNDFNLILNGRTISCPAGESVFSAERENLS